MPERNNRQTGSIGNSHTAKGLLGLAFCLLVSSCASGNSDLSLENPLGGPPKFSERLRENLKLEEKPARPALPEDSDTAKSLINPIEGNQGSPSKETTPLIYYSGASGSLGKFAAQDDELGAKTLQLNFVNAPAAEVARSVINDAFGQTLAIAENVTGQITLSSPEPVPARAALEALELVLAESGLALIRKDTGFILTTLQRAGDGGQRVQNSSNAVGYGATIIPIANTAPSEIIRLIEPFVSERLKFNANDAAGILTLQGPQADIREASDAIATFDTPFLTDRVFGIFELTYTDVEVILQEVESVLAGINGANAPKVEFIPISRLNLLFVGAKSAGDFKKARQWIERFDQPSNSEERRLRYLLARNTDAAVLAQQLSAALGFGGGAFGSVANNSDDDIGSDNNARQGFGINNSAQNNRSNQSRNNSNPNLANSPNNIVGGGTNGGASIVADELNNALIIRATDLEFQELQVLMEKMDVLAPQVLIEATIAEVTLNDDLRFGVRWFYDNAESTATLSDNIAGAIGPVFPGFSYTYLDSTVEVALDTLASVTDVTVLSAPSLMVQNNQSANLQVGDEVPIVTQTAQATIDGNAPIVSNIQLRETGVILEVTPRINAGDVVVIDVSQEVSDVTSTTTSGIDSPTIQQRRISTTVAAKNNSTIVLGGLIRENYTNNNSGIPYLKDIPLLGHAFKSRDITKNRTELVIFLTPRIVRDDQDSRAVLRQFREEMSRLFERLEGQE